MSDAIWYFVDRAQQRRGPVLATELVAAVLAGDADDTSLVWRDGMPDWLPLAQVRGELGLAGGAPAAEPAPPAPTASDAPSTRPIGVLPPGPSGGAGLPSLGAPPKSNRGCLYAVLAVIGLSLLLIVAVIVAIALPAYEEYKRAAEAATEAGATEDGYGDDPALDGTDADAADDGADEDAEAPVTPVGDAGALAVAGALAEARAVQPQVDTFVQNTDRCPRDASEIDLAAPSNPHVADLRIGVSGTRMCTIVVTLGGPGLEALAGDEITLSRDSAGDWYCTATLSDPLALPEGCF